MRTLAFAVICSMLWAGIPSSVPFISSKADAARFDKYEIRVIRDRYFTKRKRLELGAEMSVIMNQTFIYTYLGTGILTYHFIEQLGIELSGSYGFSFDKQDKSTLWSNFKIRTVVLRTLYTADAALLWTPIYGKYQLSSGKLIYFDTFLSGGAGMTGIDYKYDHCRRPEDVDEDSRDRVPEPPAPVTQSYLTFIFGLGQRFFLNKKSSLKWDVRYRMFSYDPAHGECDQDLAEYGASKMHSNVTVQLGASRFL